ncbi:MAG: hypothetical protein IT198_15595 [Acidimicrobiia bacterium]|nr:hypothetical protein [Acidimicrobiia bacterium]
MTTTGRVAAANANAPRPPPGRRRGANWPLIGLIVLFSVFVVLGARAFFGGPKPAAFVEKDLTPLAERSTAVGEVLRQFYAEPSGSAILVGDEQKPATEVLEAWAADATRIAEEAEQLDAPAELEGAFRQFVVAMQARAGGISRLASLINRIVTEGGDPNEVTSEMMDIERDFVTGDRAYAYAQAAVKAHFEGEAAPPHLPDSYWFPEPAETERPAIALFVRKLLGAPDVSGTVDVALLTLATQPVPSGVQDGVVQVVASGKFEVQVTIKNVGDQSIDMLAVKASLRPQGATDTQKASVDVTALAPGASKNVTVAGLSPAPGRNRVTVSLGPLPGEQNVQDNIRSLELDYSS